MLPSDTQPVSYMSDGPAFAGESIRGAMGENTAHALAGHLLTRPIPGISAGPQPGHGYEHEPVDQAERDATHTAQAAAKSAGGWPKPYTITGPALDHEVAAGNVRKAVRSTAA
jgi:hypothetical protein